MKIVIQGVHCETMASNLIVNVTGCNDQVYYYCSTTDKLLTIYITLSYVCVHTSYEQPVASY